MSWVFELYKDTADRTRDLRARCRLRRGHGAWEISSSAASVLAQRASSLPVFSQDNSEKQSILERSTL